MDLTKLQRTVVDALDDLKAQDIRVFNTTGITGMFDRVVIASGTSNRQTRSLASHVAEKIKAGGGEVISVEGADAGEWVLVDAGDVVVHVMQPSIRAYYNLEEIWGVKPVRLKSSAAPARTGKARKAPAAGSRSGEAAEKRAAAKPKTSAKPKAPAKPKASAKPAASARSAPRAAAAKKTASKAGASARKAPSARTAAAKPAPAAGARARPTGTRAKTR